MTDTWQQKFDGMLSRVSGDLQIISRDLTYFVDSMSLAEKGLGGVIIVLMLCYLVLPRAQDNVSGARNFVGTLLLVALVGLIGGWLASGRISF